MPKKRVGKVHVNITIDADLYDWVEKTAGEYRINKSQLINNLISMSKDDVEILKVTGFLGVVKAARKLKEEAQKIRVKGIMAKGVGDRE
ncbi:MAG: hypothetical protein ABSH06_23470 [Thermodesulfobacteriota bacterium]|jgi:hypothetical protein